MIQARFFLFSYLFFGYICVWGQLESQYRPIQIRGDIPQDLFNSVKTLTLQEAKSKQEGLDEVQGRKYYALSNYAFKLAMQSGKVYFNDEFSEYLGAIADRILADDPQLRSQIRIYATRLSVPNASAWRNGVIFFNIPLFSFLDSEAQIAYVLAHEITHFKNQHSLEGFKKQMQLENAAYNSSASVNELFELMKFSRENELEADDAAFDMLVKTDYDPREAKKALEQLAEINATRVVFSQGMQELFQLPDSLVDFEVPCDSAKYAKLPVDAEAQRDDSLSTHPAISKRIEQINQKLQALSEAPTGKAFIESAEKFDQIRDKAYFEHIHNLYESGSYFSTLYGSLRMASIYPQNQYLHEMSAKSLYWISKFTMDSERAEVVPGAENFTGSYGLFACFLWKITRNEMRELCRILIEDRLKQFPDSEELLLHLAKTQLLLMYPDRARTAFEDYLKKYPDGKYVNYAKKRIEMLKK